MPLWSIQEQTFNDEASQLSFTFTSIPESDPGENGGEGEPRPSTCVLIVGNGARSRELVIMFDRGGFKVKSDVVNGSWAPALPVKEQVGSADGEGEPMSFTLTSVPNTGQWVDDGGEGEPDPAPINELAKILGL